MVSEEINIVKENLYEWFLDNDTLIVPNLGRFEALYSGAIIQPAVHKLSPPNKTLTFNPFVKEDDGVFATFIAQNEQISPEQAHQAIQLFIKNLNEDLAVYKKHKIAGFGTFFATPEGGIAFTGDEEANYLGDSYGLGTLFSTPANHYKTKPEITLDEDKFSEKTLENDVFTNTAFNTFSNAIPDIDKEDDVLVEEEIRDKSSRRLITIVFGVLFVVCGFFIYFLLNDTNLFGGKDEEANNQNSSQNEIEKDKSSSVEGKNENTKEDEKEKETASKEDAEPQNPQITYAVNDNFLKSFTYNPAQPTNLSRVLVKSPTQRYYVILGSFSKASNAFSYYNNLLNRSINNAKILAPRPTDELYRVSCGDYPTYKEAYIRGQVFGKSNALRYLIIKY